MAVQHQTEIRPTQIEPNEPLADFVLMAVDWQSLVDHRNSVEADVSLEQVQHRFQQANLRYMAVVEQGRTIGLCSSRQVSLKLGCQYGFALFGREPIRSCMVPEPLVIRVGQPWEDVLQRVFSRIHDDFNEDVLLVGEADACLGLISVQTVVRLQTRLLRQSIACLTEQKAEIVRQNRRMTEDLLMAREMQMALLPRKLPEVSTGVATGGGAVRLASHYEPLGLVSGDFFEVLAVSETALSILIADVMGHGVQAALITAMMRALIQDHRSLAGDPGAFLTALNRSLTMILDGCGLSTFVSALALVVDTATGSLGFANAGHPCPILLRPACGMTRVLDCHCRHNGGLLGIGLDTAYSAARIGLAAGDRVLVFTDGLFEIPGPDGEILGLSGLLALAAGLMPLPGDVFVDNLVQAARAFTPSGKFEDDVCLVGLEVLEIPGPNPG